MATAEALVLARMAGLDAQQTFDVIADSAATSRMWEIRGPMMVDRTYEPATMKMDIYVKDLQLICDFARKLNCPMPCSLRPSPCIQRPARKGAIRKIRLQSMLYWKAWLAYFPTLLTNSCAAAALILRS